MKQNCRKITLRAFGIYALLNALVYLLSHIAYLFENDGVGKMFEYISYYVTGIFDFLIPTTLATVMLTLYASVGIKKALLHTALISTGRIFYTLPYYYLAFFDSFYGLDFLELLLLSFAVSVLIILFNVLSAYISVMIATLVLKLVSKKTRAEIITELPEIVKTPSTLNFLEYTNIPILVFSLTGFAFALLEELVNTAVYFVRYKLDYTAEEITTILVNYVLLFVLLILSYIVSIRVKNAISTTIYSDENTQSSDESPNAC